MVEKKLIDADGCPVLAFKGHGDGSFEFTVIQNATKVVKAFDEKGQSVMAGKMSAEPNSMPDMRFFNLGSAVRQGGTSWQLYSACGYPLCKVFNVIDFVGDGNILVVGDDEVMRLLSFDAKILVYEAVAGYEKFVNGRFVLTFEDGTKRMYEPDGRTLSVAVRDSEFLPDGCFVYYEGNLARGVYRPDGILDRREIYSYEKAGSYYLFNGEFDSGVLYDDDTQEIGKNYTLLKQEGNFCLFEHEGSYELFNQFGKVATFSAQ